MVRGFDLFRERLAAFGDSFIVIGGAACDLRLAPYGGFRRTKDIDMIVVTDEVSEPFAEALHDFLREGGYACYVTGDSRPHFYRFIAPKGSRYPAQIELLSNSLLPERPDARFTPISRSEEIRSLSAIVLDPVYYEFAKAHRNSDEGVPCLTLEALVVFKSSAYLNLLKERTSDPARVRSEDLNKHRNDVFRIMGAIPEAASVEVPDEIGVRLRRFIDCFGPDSADWESIRAAVGRASLPPEEYGRRFRKLFGL